MTLTPTKYVEGDAVILQTTEPFMSSNVLGSSVPVNPDEVIFQVQVELDGVVTYTDSWTWVNPTGDPSSTIQQGDRHRPVLGEHRLQPATQAPGPARYSASPPTPTSTSRGPKS